MKPDIKTAHNYELIFSKGEHTNYPDCYVWECANCGQQCTTKDNKKSNTLADFDDSCIPPQIRTIK